MYGSLVASMPRQSTKRNTGNSKSPGGAQELFRERLPSPCDGRRLAELALCAGRAAAARELRGREKALVAYRLDAAGWFSRDLCEERDGGGMG